MKNFFLLLLICLTMSLTGCAKGVITLDISRMGAADIDCKLVAVPVLAKGLDSFRKDFSKDGYVVTDAADGEMQGFLAHKHYANISDVQDSKVLDVFRFDKLEKAAQGTQKDNAATTSKDADVANPIVMVDKGLLFDTVTVNTHLNLKANKEKDVKTNEQWLMQNLIKQIDLRFVLRLPTRVASSNAATVSEDGKTLTWVLAMGEDTPMQASVTYCNPFKAAGWLTVVLLFGGAGYFIRRRMHTGL
jgi:hypothetical protein